MKILLLSAYPERLEGTLQRSRDSFVATNEPIDESIVQRTGCEWIVSYGYRYILKAPVLQLLPRRILNLHISFLPWNAGADPNFWSFFDETPKGVTLHWIDEGVDSGEILFQKKLELAETETLASSYQKLQKAGESLFAQTWPKIRGGLAPSFPHVGTRTYHRAQDKEPYFHQLSKGWDSPVTEVIALGRKTRAEKPI